MGEYTSIGIICEGGMASSAMGAAMLRKVLNENGLGYISVKPYAAGLFGSGAELFICQRDYYGHIKEQLKGREIFIVDSLFNKKEYQDLLKYLVKKEKCDKNF